VVDQRFNTFDHLAVKDPFNPNANQRSGAGGSQDRDTLNREEVHDASSSIFENAMGRQT